MTHFVPRALLCGSVGMALLLAGCQEEKRTAEPPRPVKTLIAKPGLIGEEVVLTGEVQPNIETDLGFRIGGRVVRRTVDVGASVDKGQVLATLDPHDVQNEVRAAEADVRSAEAAESLATTSLERQRILFEKDIVSWARIEEMQANLRTANARRRAAQAALESARNKLNDTELRAPDDGIVTAISTNSGQVVNAGQPVVKLASTRERNAVFNVSERLYATTPNDIKVEIALVSNPALKVIGVLRDASPSADPVTRTYRVRITLPDAPPEMTFGATVTGRASAAAAPLFALPASAMTSHDGKPAVFVVQPSSQELALKPVVVARYTADQALVESGLTEGDAVVTAGVSKLRPGQKVAFEPNRGEAAR